jgi:hypothetical protein
MVFGALGKKPKLKYAPNYPTVTVENAAERLAYNRQKSRA